MVSFFACIPCKNSERFGNGNKLVYCHCRDASNPRLSRILSRACSRTVEAQGLDSGPVPWVDSRLSARQVFLPTDPVSLAARQKGLSRWITA